MTSGPAAKTRPDLEPLPEHPPVSYVMPVLNEATHLGEAVGAVLSQDYPGEQELVLALGASNGRHGRGRRGAGSVRLEGATGAEPPQRHPDRAQPRDRGEPAPCRRPGGRPRRTPAGYTAAAVEILHRTGAANVGGVMVAKGRGRFQSAVARAYNSPFGLGGGSWHHGEEEIESDSAYLGVFRRAVLDEVGGYDETLRRAEDWELNHRIRSAGHLILFTPRLKVIYWPRDNWDALRRQMYATGVWRGHLVRRHQSTPWRYLPPPAVAVLVAVSVLVGLLQLFGVARGAGWALAHVPSLGYLAGVSAVGADPARWGRGRRPAAERRRARHDAPGVGLRLHQGLADGRCNHCGPLARRFLTASTSAAAASTTRTALRPSVHSWKRVANSLLCAAASAAASGL